MNKSTGHGAGKTHMTHKILSSLSEPAHDAEIERMQVGHLDLQKTDEGWQYLSEGSETDPAEWCDATSVLGPFGGSGVNDLLDELAASRAQCASLEAELVKQPAFDEPAESL